MPVARLQRRCCRYPGRTRADPDAQPAPRSPAPDGLLQSTVPHPRLASSSVAGSHSESTAACGSYFLGSCRELTAEFQFCKTEIQRVFSQLRFTRGGLGSFTFFPSRWLQIEHAGSLIWCECGVSAIVRDCVCS